jgi:hypothetical protein
MWVYGDSFDHYGAVLDKWDVQLTAQAAGSVGISAAAGRNGTPGMRFTGGSGFSDGPYIEKTVAPVGNTVILGSGLRLNGAIAGGLFGLFQCIDTTVAYQFSLVVNGDRTLSLKRGGVNGTVLATSVTALQVGTYYRIELRVVIGASGSYALRIDEVPEASVTGTGNTQGSTSSTWTRFQQGKTIGASTWGNTVSVDTDDLTIVDGSGAVFNDFLGDVQVRAHFANGPGTYAEWARGGTDSGANWSQVDEALANGDTDYVSALITGTKDAYAFENLKTPGQAVLGVQSVIQAKKAEAGSGSVGPFFRLGGVDYAPALGSTLGVTYRMATQFHPTDPAGAAWTETNFNALEAGPYKKT